MVSRCIQGIVLCACMVVPASAAAGTIDLSDLPGNQFIGPWGPGGTSLYAQSMVADDFELATVTMQAHANFFNMFFTLVVTGTRPDTGGLGLAPNFADTRYTSAIHGIPAQQAVEITFAPRLPVAPGERLFFVFDTFSYPQSSTATGGFWATAFDGSIDHYPPGEFVFLNTGRLDASSLEDLDLFTWSHRAGNNQDLGLRVEFTPEPGGVMLMMFASVVLTRRKRRRRMWERSERTPRMP